MLTIHDAERCPSEIPAHADAAASILERAARLIRARKAVGDVMLDLLPVVVALSGKV